MAEIIEGGSETQSTELVPHIPEEEQKWVRSLEKKSKGALNKELSKASKSQNWFRVKHLINMPNDRGVNINYNMEPLANACLAKNIEMTEFLLEHGANPNEQYDPGVLSTYVLVRTIPIENNDFEMIKLFVKFKADYSYNHLNKVLKRGEKRIAQLLIEAYNFALNSDSLRFARESGNTELVEYIKGKFESNLKSKKQEPKEKTPALQSDKYKGWVISDQVSVIEVKNLPGMAQLCTLFNFESEQITSYIMQNGKILGDSKAEQNFNDVQGAGYISKAFNNLKKLGGDPPDFKKSVVDKSNKVTPKKIEKNN